MYVCKLHALPAYKTWKRADSSAFHANIKRKLFIATIMTTQSMYT